MRTMLAILLKAALALVVLEFLGVLFVELSGTLDEDALIYFTVGRGILNGLTPYRDLFETKPPGIFLLTAASLLLGGTWFANVVFTGALGVTFATMHHAARRILRDAEGTDRRLLLLTSLLIALLLTLFAAYFSGGVQVEALGAAVLTVYVAEVALVPLPWGRQRILLAAIPLFLAAFLKEPFVLVAFAGALILAPSLRSLLSLFLLPAIVAGFLELIVLLVTGWLLPYLKYLSFMLTYHTSRYNGPLMLRGFFVHRILENAWNYSPFLPLLLIGLVSGAILWAWSLHSSVRGRVLHIARIGVALYLTTLAVAAGGEFFAHHFVFALSVYVALFIALLRWMAIADSSVRRLPMLALACIAVGIAFVHARRLPPRQLTAWRAHSATLRQTAATIDRVLDDCGIDRYLYLVSRGGGPFGFTRHSPLGPVFLNHNRLVSTPDSPLFPSYQTTFNEARILVLRDRESTGMTEDGWRLVERHFTPEPPPCARLTSQPLPYQILFRKEIVTP